MAPALSPLATTFESVLHLFQQMRHDGHGDEHQPQDSHQKCQLVHGAGRPDRRSVASSGLPAATDVTGADRLTATSTRRSTAIVTEAPSFEGFASPAGEPMRLVATTAAAPPPKSPEVTRRTGKEPAKRAPAAPAPSSLPRDAKPAPEGKAPAAKGETAAAADDAKREDVQLAAAMNHLKGLPVTSAKAAAK